MRRLTVRHPPLKTADEETIDAFCASLGTALKKWAERNGYTSESAQAAQLRQTLLDKIQRKTESLITAEAVAQIHGKASVAERRALVNDICCKISGFVRTLLIAQSGIPRRGRSREFAERDRRIGQMRRKGLSYGQIGKQFGIKRNAVQAAYRRYQEHCEEVRDNYPEYKRLFAALGIDLQERPALKR